jgi:microcystin-dependent protein
LTIGSNTATTLQAVYPVGSIYINAAVATNPGTLLGFGTWAAFGAGRVIVGLNAADSDFDTAQETGGTKTHTLTTAELPSHTHTSALRGNGEDEDVDFPSAGDSTNPGRTMTTDATGGGGAHNNLQPYIVAYMWRRTA